MFVCTSVRAFRKVSERLLCAYPIPSPPPPPLLLLLPTLRQKTKVPCAGLGRRAGTRLHLLWLFQIPLRPDLALSHGKIASCREICIWHVGQQSWRDFSNNSRLVHSTAIARTHVLLQCRPGNEFTAWRGAIATNSYQTSRQ